MPSNAGDLAALRTPGKQAKKPRTSYLGLQRGRGKDVFHDRAIACPSPSSTDLGSGHLILRTCRSVVGMTINALHATREEDSPFRRLVGQASAQFVKKLYLRTAKTGATL